MELLYQKPSFPHYLLPVEPDVEIAADAVDMRFGSPVCAGMFGVGMTERDMDAGNFFVLQDVSDDMRAGGVCTNRKFADPVAVFVSACVSPKFVA